MTLGCLSILLFLIPVDSQTLKIVYFRGRLERAEAALTLELAEKQLRREGILPPSVKLIIYHLAVCPPPYTNQFEPITIGADLYYKENIDAFIGPHHTGCMTNMAPIAGLWNVPILGYMSPGASLSNKAIAPTLARLVPTTSTMSVAILNLVRSMGWTKVLLVYDETGRMATSMRNGIIESFNTTEIQITTVVNATGNYEAALKTVRDSSRIVILSLGGRPHESREFMLAAREAKMTSGDYVFIVPVWYDVVTVTLETDQDREAYKSVLVIGTESSDPELVESFAQMLEDGGLNRSEHSGLTYFKYLPTLYDAMHLYGLVINESLTNGQTDLKNGSALWSLMHNRCFKGTSGTVCLDQWAERAPSYNIKNVDSAGKLVNVMRLGVQLTCSHFCPGRGYKWISTSVKNFWFNGLALPAAEPDCGFTGEKCDRTVEILVIISVIGSLIGMVLGVYGYKKWKEKELYKMPWRVRRTDIRMILPEKASTIHRSYLSLASAGAGLSFVDGNRVIVDNVSATKSCYKQNRSISFNRKHLEELNLLKQMQHDNINQFIGICFNETKNPELIVIWKDGSRGNLEDVVFNDDLNLEMIFRSSFIRDVIKGLEYIHRSPIEVHGNLSIRSCIVDGHWIVKLTDFGLQSLLNKLEQLNEIQPLEPRNHMEILHTAPELLVNQSPEQASPPSDMYSLGVVIYIILYRQEPTLVKLENPNLPALPCAKNVEIPQKPKIDIEMANILKACWDPDPDYRPTLRRMLKVVDIAFTRLTGRSNLVDHMMKMMEQYAGNLEKIVQQRTVMLLEAKQQADVLLERLLPKSIVLDLKAGREVLPQSYESATVYFLDVQGFTTLCTRSSPMEIVTFLNSLFAGFERIIEQHDVYKVETAGDSVMVVSGVPERNGTKHVTEIAQMSLELLQYVEQFKIAHIPEQQLEVRSGFHTGPVAAGVIGVHTPKYCLFGDTVNTASRMESSGESKKIQISAPTAQALLEVETPTEAFRIEPRGLVPIKGKGEMPTYWLYKQSQFI